MRKPSKSRGEKIVKGIKRATIKTLRLLNRKSAA